jgi:drug/metabolite transporter, DME family
MAQRTPRHPVAPPSQAGARSSASSSRGVLGVLCAAALWALVGLVTKRLYASSTISPLAVGTLRLALSVPALFALSAGIERRSWHIPRRDWWLFGLYGLAMAGYQLCFLGALTATTVTAATLLLTTAPAFVTLLAAVVLRERPSLGRSALLALAMLGAALVVLGSGGDGTSAGSLRLDPLALRGDALALGAALAYAGYYLLSGVLGPRYGGIQIMTIAIAVGAALLLPAALIGGGLGMAVRTLDGAAWALLLVLALGSTAIAYAIYGLALRHTPATLASVAALVEPVIASVLAWYALGERLAPIGLLGGALVLGGIAGTYVLRMQASRAPTLDEAASAPYSTVRRRA